MSFISSAKLNPAQREAAETVEGPLLVLAGAGSGKTRVLTHRVAHMILDLGISPYQILAITFTNKATGEMKERIAGMCGEQGEKVWVSTFHSACARILRSDIQHLGYKKDYSIYDDDDCQKLIARLFERHTINEKLVTPKYVKSCISSFKNRFESLPELRERYRGQPQMEAVLTVYASYEQELQKNNALDFDDLIVKTLRLFHDHPEVLARYQDRFRYILVDEYQDTNHCQYLLVKLLAGTRRNLCVVGDDDQSIYGWRGADVANILDFEKDFKNAKVVKLEQNYRSTETILQAANGVIANNKSRKKKTLWSSNGAGAPVCRATLGTDREEAQFVINKIAALAREGMPYSDIAVLYRVNSTSRILEDALIGGGIPYRVYGGLRFYDRKEVKDALAYLRLIVNPSDELALRRIINVPKRGIGEISVEQLALQASGAGESLFGVIMEPELYPPPARLAKKLADFSAIISELVMLNETLPPHELVRETLEKSGLLAEYQAENTPEAETRLDNLLEMQSAAAEYMAQHPEGTLSEYLETVALVTETEKDMSYDHTKGSVSLMTVHSAKGLEFDAVFLVAAEEGTFPLARAILDLSEMEEERRLCYVALTRAKKRLFVTSAGSRMLYGETRQSLPSRFLEEIPAECVQEETPRPTLPRNMQTYPADERGTNARPRSFDRPIAAPGTAPPPLSYRSGDKVRHKSFGAGTVISVKGLGRDLQLDVAFPGLGIKTLSASAAPLEKLV